MKSKNFVHEFIGDKSPGITYNTHYLSLMERKAEHINNMFGLNNQDILNLLNSTHFYKDYVNTIEEKFRIMCGYLIVATFTYKDFRKQIRLFIDKETNDSYLLENYMISVTKEYFKTHKKELELYDD